jgi:AcrR family transcriptional regulator
MSKIRPTTKVAIIEAAFAIYAETPTASLGDVAARAGVGRATLHRHFPGRPELMRALAQIAMQELDAAVTEATQDAPSYAEGFRRALSAIVPLANRQLFLANEGLEADPEVAAAHAQSHAALLENVKAAQAEGAFDPALPATWIAAAYEALIYAAWNEVKAGEATPKQAAGLAWRTLTQGLKG